MEISQNTTTFEGPSLGEFFKAMAAAQTEMDSVFKDAANPAFRSKYASLAAVCDAVLPAMNKQGLTVLQVPSTANGEVIVETIIGHSSGTMMRSPLSLRPTKNDPQGVGSAITYGRRYSLMALAGVAPEDDDGNAASASTTPPIRSAPPPPAAKPAAQSRELFSKLQEASRMIADVGLLSDLYRTHKDEIATNKWSAEIIAMFADRRSEIEGASQEEAA